MIALSELSKQFGSEKISVKILKPWWDVITDYLVIFLLMISVLVGGMELTSGSFECLPAVDCPLTSPKNGTLLSGTTQHNACTAFKSFRKTSGREAVTTVVTDVKNLLYVKYVNSECSKNDLHWFTSYFSLFLLAQALILLILDNFWLKFPSTASIIETFCVLVVECYNSPGTSFGLSRILWNLPDINQTSEGFTGAQNLDETEKLLGEQQDNDNLPSSSTARSINHELSGDVSVDLATVISIKTLYEKIKRFKEYIKSSQRIWKVYLIQTVLQTVLTLVFIIINALNRQNVQGTIKCTINKVSLPVEYDYFTCSHNLVPVFEIALVLFLVLLALALGVFTFILIWTMHKVFRKKRYDFENELKSHDWITTEAVDLTAAKEDMGFLLQLLHAYNKLYVVRFAIFMSEENEKKIKNFILANEWPLTKLERHCEGRKLRLNRLSGIPQTLFDLDRLNTLELTRCGPLEEDDFNHFSKLLDLRKLSLVNCGLTKIPEKVLDITLLEVLILKHNSIESIQDDIWKLENLVTVDISNNKLQNIPETFIALCNLLTFRLSNNPTLNMTSIKNVLACKKLQVLEMPPLTKAQEKELNDEEKQKFATVNVQLTITGKGDRVIPYAPTSAPQISKIFQNNQDRVYKMNSRPKGIALIINNISFKESHHTTRYGSQKDVSRLKRLFGQIGFVPTAYENCTASKARKLLQDHTMDKTYEDCDSLVVVIMSHGDTEGIIFIDGEAVNTKELVEIVEKSPIYKGKPKLFFIQTCRGSRQHGHVVKTSQRLVQQVVSDANFGGKNTKNEETLGHSGFEPLVPQYADVLLSFSTLPGYVSYRNTEHGSWYVSALVEVFANHAWEEDVLSLLTMVNYQVSRYVTSSGWKQIPAPQSTLTKKLFLLPGYPATKFTSYV